MRAFGRAQALLLERRRSARPTRNEVSVSVSARCCSSKASLGIAHAGRQRAARGDGVLDVVERAQRGAGIVGERFLLLQRADSHLGAQRAALEDGREQARADAATGILEIVPELEDLAVEVAEVQVERDLRQLAALAWPMRLKAAATRRSAAITSGRRSSTASGTPTGGGRWHGDEVGARGDLGRRISA